MTKIIVGHSCHLRAETSTTSSEIQAECGKCNKIFNVKYYIDTKGGVFSLEVFLKKSRWMGLMYFMSKNRKRISQEYETIRDWECGVGRGKLAFRMDEQWGPTV